MAVDKVSKVLKSGGVTIKPGSKLGLFLGIIHLGTQKSEFEGRVSYKDQVLLKFELPSVLLPDGRPVTLSKRETHVLGSGKGKESNLLKLGRALNDGEKPEGIDWEESLGKPVLLELKENKDKTGVNISGYLVPPEEMVEKVKPLVNEPVLELDVDNIPDKAFKGFPEWLQKVINERVQPDDQDGVDAGIDY